MKLATFKVSDGDRSVLAGVLEEGRLRAFAEGEDAVRGVLAGTQSTDGHLGTFALSDVTLLAPVPNPGTIYAIGLNYANHIAEMGHEPPREPVLFTKLRGSLTGPSGPVSRPAIVSRLDYEGELALVIGAGGRLGGLCIADDISARELQERESQWTRAKGGDTFCPCGPWITTIDEIDDPLKLQVRTWVNGELRQDSSTENLVFGPDALIDFIAEVAAPQPGDLILTGTPGGVGQGMQPPRYLQPGDRVRVEIEPLGSIEHKIV
jgi:2-keto-4-pentenoate hydratase/2-oxohepta-3-ene-1,7-dioic acid hydratase in catechol pathway